MIRDHSCQVFWRVRQPKLSCRRDGSLGHASGEKRCTCDFRPENRGDFVWLHRAADQEALGEVAVATFQEFELPNGFNTFRGNFDIKALCHRDRRSNNALVAVVVLDIRDQRLVEHKTVNEAAVD